MKARLTDSLCASLAPPIGKDELLAWDDAMPGLALRVGKIKKSWSYVFRPAGAGNRAPQKIKLGVFPAVTVKAARAAAQIEAGKVARGLDPAAIRREQRRAQAARLEAALDAYESDLTRRGVVKRTTALSALRRELGAFAKRDVATISRLDVVRQIERLDGEGKPGAAQDLRKHAMTFFAWAVTTGRAAANPLAGMQRPKATRLERIETEERGRALSDAELAKVWRAATPATSFGRYLRALVLTGARRGELAALKWDMVGKDRITLPASSTKQGRVHQIPITPELQTILDVCPRGASGIVFASPKTGGAIRGWNTLVAGARKDSGVTFALHDLRRTMRTGMTRLGVAGEVAELAIGHGRTGLAKIYDKSDLWDERVAAAALWAAHVEKAAQARTPE